MRCINNPHWRWLTIALLVVTATGCVSPAPSPLDATIPQTARPIQADPQEFHFAMVGDRTAGHRVGVFEQAMAQLNLLRPEFVINVGDLIEGYSEDQATINAQWDEIEEFTQRLGMKFFYVPGNHDISNDLQRREWNRRFGKDHYHFVYKNVLFVVLNTEDPPPPKSNKRALLSEYGGAAMGKVMQALQANPDADFPDDPKLMELARKVRSADAVNISPRQVESVRQTLARNKDVRWTVFLMHRPGWRYQSGEFRQIERMTADRPYSMFAGHFHKYAYEQRNGRDYITLGTTGGSQPTGSVDHLMWVTMTSNGPEIANILQSGLSDRKRLAVDVTKPEPVDMSRH
ncbi:hypothetical protein B9N43_16270 [Denitratisoma sp. DHT3]|uniref:metallophosphoesterase family protein n=1 Tax=Denitratisoma sp. DHT3 TaxID=1981880 RepID=UPI0011983991|nr:metallophosphoesterase [Denitratisoma sp. DHT3]QDX82650.1 hypothetical protein B9N43_16270 [Denitratisoma sp. DHT3]